MNQPVQPTTAINPHQLIDDVADELDLLSAHIIVADTVARTVKLAVATIARVLISRGGWSRIAVADLLGVPTRTIARTLWALESGHLDTVAAHHDFTTAARFVAYIEGLATLTPERTAS